VKGRRGKGFKIIGHDGQRCYGVERMVGREI
jgi:hypothetical protein